MITVLWWFVEVMESSRIGETAEMGMVTIFLQPHGSRASVRT